jgi:hypothetical protein
VLRRPSPHRGPDADGWQVVKRRLSASPIDGFLRISQESASNVCLLPTMPQFADSQSVVSVADAQGIVTCYSRLLAHERILAQCGAASLSRWTW